jgi:TonB-dependent starch-binding outer membrane protein SusC
MKLLTSFLFVLIVSTAFAYGSFQQQNLTGTVTDATTGNPLIGVNVLIEGSLIGTTTDLNGKFALKKPENGAVITFSFIGYESQKIRWSGQPVIDIKLSQNVLALDEVVVTGYGTQKKSDLTGSISKVSSKEIGKTSPINVEAALQGRVPGLMISSSDGSPGNEASIRVRGIGTVNDNDPIFVVDGMPIDNSDKTWMANTIGFLNPSDIASIEVLKDASSQAIYGSRGANGVILITTRKGTQGAPKVTFNSSFTYESLGNVAPILDNNEYKDFVLTSNYNGYIRANPEADPNVLPDTLNPTTRAVVEQYNKGYNTYWMKEILQEKRLSQNYDFSLSGGTKDFHYMASAGYTYKKGLVKTSEYKRYSFRLNTDFNASQYVTIGENLGISSNVRKGDWYFLPVVRSAMWNDPLSPVLKPEGTVDINDPDYYLNKYAPQIGGGANPVMQTELTKNNETYFTLVGNIFAEATILKDFKLRSSWGVDLAFNDFSHYDPTYYLSSISYNEISKLSEQTRINNGWVWENTLTWNKRIGIHNITALIGYTSEYTKIKIGSEQKQGTPSNAPEMQTFDAATTQPVVSGTYNVFTLASLLGRINYSLYDKYLFTASIRRDGSSKFAQGNKWGTFPSFSLGWKISDENFLKNFNSGFFSSLKLRAGWGQIGNSSLPVYNAYVSQIGSTIPNDDLRYIFNEFVYQGYWLKTIGTPDITWETTEQSNIGVDMAFFKNALTVTADYYIKNTKNMLLQVPVVLYAGYPSSASPYTNAGSVQNKGFEILMNWQQKKGDFSYGISLNGATFKNKVTSLGEGNKPIISEPNRTEVGSSIGGFYGYVTNGIFQSEYSVQSETGVTGHVMQPNAHAGDFRFLDLNADGKIDVNDETWIGSPWPILTYGLNLNFGYKGFDLLLFFQGSYGNDIYDTGRQYGNSQGVMYSEYYYRNAWKGPGTSNFDPILTTVDENENYYKRSDYYIEDGSYLRLKNIQLGYSLPKRACDKMRITSLRFWAGGTNLLTFTKYLGNDPEVGAVATPTSGAGTDWAGFYPRSREISAGVNLSF